MNEKPALNDLLTKATQVQQQGQFSLAEELYNTIINLYPDNPDALHLLGVTYSQQSNYQQAIETIQKAIFINPHPMYYFNLGESYRMSRQFNEAVIYLKKALEMAPNFPNIYFSIAKTHLESGDFISATENFNKVLELQPGNFRALFNLGNIMLNKGNNLEAINYYRQVIRMNPNFAEAYNNLGIALGDSNEAINAFRQSLILVPNYHEARNNLANLLKKRNNFNEAEALYNQVLKDNPDDSEAYLSLAKLFSETENYQSAIPYYEKFTNLRPSSPETYNDLGFAYFQTNKMEQAIEAYKKAIELKPDYTTAYKNLGKVFEGANNVSEARKSYLQILKIAPENKLLELYTEIFGKSVYDSSKEIDDYQQHLLDTIDRFTGTEFKLDLSILHYTNIRPPLSLIYQGKNDRKIREKFANMFNITPFKPSLSLSKGANSKPQIGIVITPRHEGILTKLYRGVLNRISLNKFDITIICHKERGIQIIRPSIKNQNIKFMDLTD